MTDKEQAQEAWSEKALEITNDNFPYEDDREGDPISQDVQAVAIMVLDDYKAALKAKIEKMQTQDGDIIYTTKAEVLSLMDTTTPL